MRGLLFIFVFSASFLRLYSDINLYFQKALTGKVAGNPIIDEKRDTITVLTKDRWLTTYTMSFEKKYSYRLNRMPYPFLLKDFDNGYYVITVRNEVQKIRRGKLVWKYKLDFSPLSSPAIGNVNILIPLVNEKVVSIDLNSGKKMFEVDIGGRPATSPVVFDNGDFCIASENDEIFLFDFLGNKKWFSRLIAFPFLLMINTKKEVVVGHKSGHIVAYGRDFGEVISSIKLDFPINFLFEKFNGEYVAISNVGMFFDLNRNFKLKFKKKMNFEIEKAVLYNNRNLLISTKSNGILSFEEDFDISFSDAKLKGLSGLSANSGIIVLGGDDWVLSTYYYEYDRELDVSVWNHFGGNKYNQGRIDLKEKRFVDYDKNYLLLEEILNSNYSDAAYNKFLEILDFLAAEHGNFPAKYLNLYEKAFNVWLLSEKRFDRITSRGKLYRYFVYVNDKAAIKSFINLAIRERDINNIITIVKTITKFESYYGQDCIIYNYIQNIVLNYQGNLEIAYSVILNLRNIILNSTAELLKLCKHKYIKLLMFMRRQNFSENINKHINEIISSIQDISSPQD
ncbi:PQQ-binding-like beta-propeller repeat protein [Borreliella burgdorferi]|uniref:PQQ-binding-like beta-propeller repeat protein n=1 Tax=Borreliella burgdorferi TaxID=139 RepID=UPI001C386254|nr:PQQ-binding-like beta-propeller repeat protein [Borreliella burgdorferi]QXG44427.1 PQQ-binding-like beta-propeller repeat protein [Borreliella burgdorferi]WNY61367.1 PQQ-binding-like beta-propeller repeat protein [Borreliella burgdorferi]